MKVIGWFTVAAWGVLAVSLQGCGSSGGSTGGTGPAACLCVFDIDRTLTGKQGEAGACPGNQEISGVNDSAYGGGTLVLSKVGQSLEGTFCATKGCYVGVVSAGDGSGHNSTERAELVKRLGASGAKLASEEWCGPSSKVEARATCQGFDVTSPLVVGCVDGTKQYAVKGIMAWIAKTENVTLKGEDVYHFDDRANNISPFSGFGFNAIEVSCASRDKGQINAVGQCGADPSEIVEGKGVKLCSTKDDVVV